MSLRFKLLFALYTAVGLVWLVHASWQMSRFEKAAVAAEIRAAHELASGLRVYLRHLAVQHQTLDALNAELAAGGWDIMIIGRDLRVVAASDRSRVGRAWAEPGIRAVLRGEVDFTHNDHEHDGHRVIDVTLAVEGPNGGRDYVVHAARRQDDLQAELKRQRHDHFIMLGMAFVLMALMVSTFTHRMILSPLARVQRRIPASHWGAILGTSNVRDLHALEQLVLARLERIEADQSTLHAAVREKTQLLEQVGQMRDALQAEVERVRQELQSAQTSLLRAERHAALAQLSGALAHELRNPLHIVRGLAETAGRRQPAVAPYVEDIKSEVDRIEQLIRKLLQFTRPLDLDQRVIRVKDVLDSACDRVARARAERGKAPCRVTASCESGPIQADPVLLGQAIENLLENACDAAGADGSVAVRVATADGFCTLRIQDSGAGIAEEDLQHVFQPFFTRKPAGTGLGLSVALRIVELHGGDLTLANFPSGGLIATVRLPVEPKDPP